MVQRRTTTPQPRRSQSQRYFTVSEVAEYNYCQLVWWYEQNEPLVRADNDELYAHLVEIEQEYGAQAPSHPDYQFIEQLLIRNGEFDGKEMVEPDEPGGAELEHTDSVYEGTESITVSDDLRYKMRMVVIGLIIIGMALMILGMTTH